MTEQVDDFLAHYGVRGMMWGKRNARANTDTPRPKMSLKKKVAIAVGVGATVAAGAVVTVAILNNKKKMSIPVPSVVNQPSTAKGKAAVKASDTYLLDSYRKDQAEKARVTISPSNLKPKSTNSPSLDVLSDIMNKSGILYDPKTKAWVL